MKQQILLHNATPEEFTQTILDGVKQILATFQTPISEDDLLTREETCELLSINLSTLWSWSKKGKLKSFGIGNRVYYKKNEVYEALKPLYN